MAKFSRAEYFGTIIEKCAGWIVCAAIGIGICLYIVFVLATYNYRGELYKSMKRDTASTMTEQLYAELGK